MFDVAVHFEFKQLIQLPCRLTPPPCQSSWQKMRDTDYDAVIVFLGVHTACAFMFLASRNELKESSTVCVLESRVVRGLCWQCAWCDFESALFSLATLNRISHRPCWKVKYLHVEIVECIVRRRVSHGQPFPLQRLLVLCLEACREPAQC